MIRRARFGFVVVALLVSTAAFGQNWSGHVRAYSPRPQMAAPHTSTSPHPAMIRLPATPAMRRVVGSPNIRQVTAHGAAISGESPTAFDFVPASSGSLELGQVLNNVPGLGFDYSHVAALNHDFGVRAIIDPVTQHEVALAEKLLQSQQSAGTPTFVPFYGIYGGEYSQTAVYGQQPPQIIILQQPAPAPQTHTPEQTPPQAPAAAQPQPPLPPVGEFVLVLRSGKQIKAVAFTRQADSIVYITKDGARRSFPVADLDVAATEQLNQQHGTPLKLSL